MTVKKCYKSLWSAIEFEPKNNDTYYNQCYKSDIQSIKTATRRRKLQRKIKFFQKKLPV